MPASSSSRPSLLTNLENARATLAACFSLAEPLERAGSTVASALRDGRKILVCGNGGSAADAMHLSGELLGRFVRDRRPYPSICLSANGSDLTSIANDYSFDQVFERQVRGLAQAGDVLIALSSSGNSRNVLLAIEAAEQIGAKSIAFLGKGGGITAGKASIELIVPETSVTARIQEAQKVLLHTLCELVEWELGDSR